MHDPRDLRAAMALPGTTPANLLARTFQIRMMREMAEERAAERRRQVWRALGWCLVGLVVVGLGLARAIWGG